jgi:hypothetical protein
VSMERNALVALADNYRALNASGEAEDFIALLAHVWGVEPEDDDDFAEFLYRLGTTMLMLSDHWREHGVPEVATRWAEP